MSLLLLVEQTDDRSTDAQAIIGQVQRLGVDAEPQLLEPGDASIEQRLCALRAHLDRCVDRGVAATLITASAVVPDAVLLRLLADPGLQIGALVTVGQTSHPVATQGPSVLAGSTDLHRIEDPDAGFVGALYLDAEHVGPAAAALQRAIDDGIDPSWDTLDLLDLVLTTLVRSAGDAITAVRVEPFPGARAGDSQEAEALADAIAALDDPELAERNARRTGDGFYSTVVLRRISARITPWAVRHGIAANVVTSISAVVGIAGGVAFAFGHYPALLLGAILLQISLVLDCVDGEIARATRTRSTFGAWLDGATDRVKEYAALAGLAAAGAHAGHHLWILAASAMVVQTARHMQDFAFAKGALAAWRGSFRDSRPLSDTTPWLRPPGAGVLMNEPTSASMWLRRVIHMPIGERWLVLSVGAAAGSPLGAIVTYLALVSVAELWSLLGAIRRTTAAVGQFSPSLRQTLADYRDDGLLGVLTGRRSPSGVLGWALPALVTAAEGAAVLVPTALWHPHWAGAAYAWFAVVAWHRYDVVYRRGGSTPSVPALVSRLGGGWLVRSAVVIVAAALGALPAVLVVGLAWLALCYLPESLYHGVRTRRQM